MVRGYIDMTNKKDLKILIVGIVMLILVGLLGFWIIKGTYPLPSSAKTDNFTPTTAAMRLNEDNIIEFELTHANVKMGNYIGMYSLDLSDAAVQSINVFSAYNYYTYYRNNGSVMYEIYIGEKPDVNASLGIWKYSDIMGYLNSRSNEPMINEDEHDSEDGSMHYVSQQAIQRVYDKGFVFVSETYIDGKAQENGFDGTLNSGEYAKNIANSMLFTKASPNVQLTIDGIGTYNVNELRILNSNCGILYSALQNIVYLWNQDKEETAVFISGIDNVNLNNLHENLIRYNDYNNVYIDRGFRNNTQWGVGTFAIQTMNGTYSFKINESILNHQEVMGEILRWLQIKPEDTKMEIPFNIVYTMDDLMEANTEPVD